MSACCSVTSVLDFGKLIASGPTAEVLRNEHVIKAYLGAEDEDSLVAEAEATERAASQSESTGVAE